jgi:tetratricopeptide (TPR) repeat protein
MEENPLAKQVAEELKGLITASVKSIRDGEYQHAGEYLRQALSVTELIGYHAGSAMVYYNLANLYAVQGENMDALRAAALAHERAQASHIDESAYQKLVQTFFLAVQKEGVDCIKGKDHIRALSCFETALPHAPEGRKPLLEQQIVLLRRVLDERR